MSLFGPNVNWMLNRRDVGALIEALKYEDKINIYRTGKYKRMAAVRASAAKALGALGDSRAVGPLSDSLTDGCPYVRAAAAEALGELGDLRAVEPLLVAFKDQMTKHKAEMLYNDDDRLIASEAIVNAIGKLHDVSAVEPLITLFKAGYYGYSLQIHRDRVNAYTARSLGMIGDPRALEPLTGKLRYYSSGSGETYLNYIVAALGDIGDARALPAIFINIIEYMTSFRHRELEHPENLPPCYVSALVKIGAKSAAPLVSALKHQVGWVRLSVAEALKTLGWQPDCDENAVWYEIAKLHWDKCVKMASISIQPLLEVFQKSGGNIYALEKKVHADTARTLAQIGGSAVADPLVDSLLEKITAYAINYDYVNILLAIEDLGNLGSARAVDELISWLKYDGWPVRYAAGEALVKIYKNGAIDQATKVKILSVRPIIIAPQISEYDRSHIGQGVASRKDFVDGLGINFPV